MKYVSKNLEETAKISHNFVVSLGGKDHNQAVIVGLYGDLGSGKTTFTQLLAKELGVTETVTSPTFVIEKIYKLKDQVFEYLIHIDAYRLEKASELLHLGWEEIIANPKNLILIEWPERVAEILPKETKKIKFTFIDETTREIEIEE